VIPPLTIILAALALAIVIVLLAYGSGFHRGHVSGFHEGLDVARDDIEAIREDHYRWRRLQDTPRFPCRLVTREQRTDLSFFYSVREFDNDKQWGAFRDVRYATKTDTQWYDLRRIEKTT